MGVQPTASSYSFSLKGSLSRLVEYIYPRINFAMQALLSLPKPIGIGFLLWPSGARPKQVEDSAKSLDTVVKFSSHRNSESKALSEAVCLAKDISPYRSYQSTNTNLVKKNGYWQADDSRIDKTDIAIVDTRYNARRMHRTLKQNIMRLYKILFV